jgi:hypothetical protein
VNFLVGSGQGGRLLGRVQRYRLQQMGDDLVLMESSWRDRMKTSKSYSSKTQEGKGWCESMSWD